MECNYKEISVNEETKIVAVSQWRLFLRQLLVSSSVWTLYFVAGLCLGAPTVYIPQLRQEANSTGAVGEEMASWLSSMFGYTALPWIFILSSLVRIIGRKRSFTIVCFITLAMFISFCLSSTATHLVYTTILQGITHGCCITVSIIIVSEYTAPKYRGLFLTIKSATLMWGIWAANFIGTFFHWKFIPLFGVVCTLYPILAVFFWPESPYWLAGKGWFEKCAKAHRWLKGTDLDSEKELEDLIDSQMKSSTKEKNVKFKSYVEMLCLRQFYMPLGICLLMAAQYHFSGKFVCSIYSIEIIKRITNNETTAYRGMLILDGVTVFSMYIGCALSKILKRRTLLFITSTVGISFLFIMSIYLYLVKLNAIEENKYLSILFLSCFSLSIGSGPTILATSIYGELIPSRLKRTFVITISLIFYIMEATLLKLSPYIFKSFGMHGTFLFFAISATIFTSAIYKYLPETKDKTLQEIEACFIDKTEVTTELVNKEKKNEFQD